MIAHEHIGMDTPAAALTDLPQRIQKHPAILIVRKDFLAAVPAAHHVINGAAVFHPWFPWHSVYTFSKIQKPFNPYFTRLRD